jgi:hypothetical protein
MGLTGLHQEPYRLFVVCKVQGFNFNSGEHISQGFSDDDEAKCTLHAAAQELKEKGGYDCVSVKIIQGTRVVESTYI